MYFFSSFYASIKQIKKAFKQIKSFSLFSLTHRLITSLRTFEKRILLTVIKFRIFMFTLTPKVLVYFMFKAIEKIALLRHDLHTKFTHFKCTLRNFDKYSHVTTTSAKIYFYHPNKFPGTPFQLSPPPSLAPGNADPLSAHFTFKNSFPSCGGTGKTTEIRFFQPVWGKWFCPCLRQQATISQN